jgi:acetylornithine deacetylase
MREVETAAMDLLAALVGIDSVNPGLVPGATGEARIVEHLRVRLTDAGFATTIVPALGHDDRPSLVAVPPGPPEWPTVVLNGHLVGRASLGSEALVAALPGLGVRPDACLIAEPTDLALSRSLRGFAAVRVTFTGRAAHSSQAELGVNAVTHLGRLLHAVDARADDVRATGGDLMVTLARGGESAFVVPDHAECLVELRTTPDRSSADAIAEVSPLLEPEWHAEVKLGAHHDGWRLDEAGPAAALARRLGAELGTGPTFDAPYWMEAPLWQATRRTLVCGPPAAACTPSTGGSTSGRSAR